MKVFYDHIIIIHDIHAQIEEAPVHADHKTELVELIEDTVHHRIIHKILDLLHHDHHEPFLARFHQAPHDRELLDYLKNHVPDIEHHIKQAANEVKYELIKEIRSH